MRRLSYTRKILDAVRQKPQLVKPGTITNAYIAHDDWCLIFKGGDCNCNPDVTLVPEREIQ